MRGLNQDLLYFVEIANSLNLSKASQRLGVSQPSLTKCLQRLEAEFKVSLFLRSSKGLKMTTAGQKLQAETQRLLLEFEGLKTKMREADDKVEGILKIGCHPSVALYSLPEVLTPLLKKYESLNLVLEHDLSRKITESVISSRLDVGLVINPIAHPDLIIKKVTTDEVSFWQGAHTNKGILLADLELNQTQQLLKKLKKVSMNYERIISCPNLEVIAELVSHGAGHGILPSRVALRGGRNLKKIHSAPTFFDELCFVYRAENRHLRKIKVFHEEIQRSLSR